MTHDLESDATLLVDLLASPAPYVGLMGPRRRTARLFERLRDAGRLPDPGALERLQTPVGLDLGADAPEEVTLSILAAITARRHDRSGGVLQQISGPIHDAHTRTVEEIETP
jgi:xanthine/CO dehydrogenase XdhC/CoxF family maturation factor